MSKIANTENDEDSQDEFDGCAEAVRLLLRFCVYTPTPDNSHHGRRSSIEPEQHEARVPEPLHRPPSEILRGGIV